MKKNIKKTKDYDQALRCLARSAHLMLTETCGNICIIRAELYNHYANVLPVNKVLQWSVRSLSTSRSKISGQC